MVKCPSEKHCSNFILKGSGWYVTGGYGAAKESTAEKSVEKPAATEKSTEATATTKSESDAAPKVADSTSNTNSGTQAS